ncbi:hypothetical protein L1887_30005 [Cichorium endivia]|nr:hypothetical protein L1887_30005 [Cichorium endivia]
MEVYLMLVLFSSTIFFSLSSSAAVDTLTANQPIKDGNTIISDGEMYELGFFSPGKSKNRYLGIWYKKISTGTVVWVANRDSPISDTSGVFEVGREGSLLILSGSTNTVIWSSNTTASVRDVNPVAQLLDTGNLIVWDESSTKENPIWQSFDYPGNTLLPGMKLGKDLITETERSITTWKSPDDPSIGLYKLRLDTNGYPQVFMGDSLVDIFRLAPWNGVGFRGIPVENTNSIYSVEFVVNQTEIYYKYELKGSVVQRIIVMSDGILLHMSWINRTQQWVVYGSIAVDSCSQYGRCGPYGSCFINTYPPCSCMQGFEPRVQKEWNAGDWSSGCQRETPLDCGSGDGFQKLSGVKFPDTRRSRYNVSMSLGECEMACRRNCSCTAYATLDIRNGGSGCLLWFDELMDIGEHDDHQDLYIRLATSKLAGRSSLNKKNEVLTMVICVSFAALFLCAVAFVCRKKKKMPHKKRRDSECTIFFSLLSSAAVDTISALQPIKDGSTIVSSGETETPISDASGVFEVTREGTLLIHSGGNTVIWSSNSVVSVRNVSSVAQLLDSGNLVMWDENSTKENPIWQSFDYPGNTLLPGMKLGKDLITGRERYLTSWKSPADPSIGVYKYWLDTNGYPQIFERKGLVEHSRLGPWNGLGFSGLPIENTNPIYSVEFAVNQKEMYYRYELKSSVIQRIIVMRDGIILQLNWIELTQEWVTYRNIVVDSCSRYGPCGPYGICAHIRSPPCSCMEGFETKVPEEWNAGDWSSGCQRKKPLNCVTGDGFQKISGVKFPDTRRSRYNVSMSLGECEMACRRNCSCTAYASLDIRNGGSGCLLWFSELMDMREHDENQHIYIRMATSTLAGTQPLNVSIHELANFVREKEVHRGCL